MDFGNITKNEVDEVAVLLSKKDISLLVDNLKSKNSNLRYNSFLLLKKRSEFSEDVYPYFDIFKDMLNSKNPYHKHIALYLTAKNAKYSKKYDDNKFLYIIDSYLQCCNFDNYSVARHCIQSIPIWIKHYPELIEKVSDYLMGLDLKGFRESGRDLILFDIVKSLILIEKIKHLDKTADFIHSAISDKKMDGKMVRELLLFN